MDLKDISLRVGDRQVFRGLSLRSDAKHIGVVGPNGAGKSSLLRLLQGLLQPEQGSVSIDRPVGLVFQNPDHQVLFPTVLEELTFGLTERGVPGLDAERQAREMAQAHGACDALGLATHELSAGQKTLVCLLSVLIDQPKTLLLDESFANLDLTTAHRMTKLIQATPERVIFSTHQLNLLETFDEVIWLDQGSVQMQGSALVVLEAYRQNALDRA